MQPKSSRSEATKESGQNEVVHAAQSRSELHSLPKSSIAGWLADFAWVPWALLTLFFIVRFQVDVPTIDQWEADLPFLKKVAQGTAGLSDLVAFQLEHRIGFTRALSVMVAWLSGWNSRFFSLVVWSIMFMVAIVLCLLNRRTCGYSLSQRFVTNFVGGSVLFGLAQYDLWINAMMSSWVSAEVTLLAGICIVMTRLTMPAKFLLCIPIAIVATFSSSMGMQLWILLLAMLLAYGRDDKAWSRRLWIGLWAVSAVVSIWLYASGYTQPPEVPPKESSPVKLFSFFLAVMGSPFAIGTVINPVFLALLAGLVMLLVYCVCLGAVVLLWSERDFVRRAMPWLCLASLGIVSCAAISIGRAGFPLDVALAARYITAPAFSTYMLFALFPFVLRFLTIPDNGIQRAEARDLKVRTPIHQALGRIPILGAEIPFLSARASTLIKATLVTTVCFTHLCFSVRSGASFENENIRYTAGKAAILFSRSFLDRELLANVWFERLMPQYKDMIDFMDAQDYLRPNTFESAKIYDLPKVFDSSDTRLTGIGGIEQVGNVGDGNVGFSGWAMLPNSKRPADVVLLSAGQDEQAVVFGVIPVGGRRPDVEEKLGFRPYKGCGWGRVFPKTILPTSPTQIRAWALDVDSGTAYELAGAVDFQPQ